MELHTALIRKKAGKPLILKLLNTFHEKTGRARCFIFSYMKFSGTSIQICPFQIIPSLFYTVYLEQISEGYQKLHVPVQIWTHTADSGIARMECTGILGS